MIHTPGWVHLGVGTLFMKEDNIVVVMESVDVDGGQGGNCCLLSQGGW